MTREFSFKRLFDIIMYVRMSYILKNIWPIVIQCKYNAPGNYLAIEGSCNKVALLQKARLYMNAYSYMFSTYI